MEKVGLQKIVIVSWGNNFVAISRQNHQSFRIVEIRLKHCILGS